MCLLRILKCIFHLIIKALPVIQNGLSSAVTAQRIAEARLSNRNSGGSSGDQK